MGNVVQSDLVAAPTIEKLAEVITRQAMNRWGTYLHCYKDEVLSEAYLAVMKSVRHYEHQINETSWTPAVAMYSYGSLVSSLKTQRYLPGPCTLYARTNTDETLFEDMEE